MQTWVVLAGEEGTDGVPALICADGDPPPTDLDGLDYALLGQWTERKSWSAMAKTFGITPASVYHRVKRPAFQAVLTRLHRNLFDQLSRGEYGGLALIKANSIGLVKNALRLAYRAEDERVRLNATLELIKLGGIQPPKPAVIERPETLLDQMTVEELEHFGKTNEFPRRLSDKLARVAATVLQGREQTTAEAVTAESVARELAAEEAESAPGEAPLEVAEDEAPDLAPLPDETAL